MELAIRFADSELEPVTGLAQSPYRLELYSDSAQSRPKFYMLRNPRRFLNVQASITQSS